MTESTLRCAGRAIVGIHRTGPLVPAIGLATISASAYETVALAHPLPETAFVPDGLGECRPFDGDFGCGHGFGCACHLLPEPPNLI